MRTVYAMAIGILFGLGIDSMGDSPLSGVFIGAAITILLMIVLPKE